MSWQRRDFLKTTAAGMAWPGLSLSGLPRPQAGPVTPEQTRFEGAKPVWPKGRTKEKNLQVGFRCEFQAPAASRVVLRIAASSLYRAFLNGEFCAHGPARGPHGYFRVDEWDLTSHLQPGANVIAIEVAGYNINSYYLLDQPSFLQAEVRTDSGRLMASTGNSGNRFDALILKERRLAV